MSFIQDLNHVPLSFLKALQKKKQQQQNQPESDQINILIATPKFCFVLLNATKIVLHILEAIR